MELEYSTFFMRAYFAFGPTLQSKTPPEVEIKGK